MAPSGGSGRIMSFEREQAAMDGGGGSLWDDVEELGCRLFTSLQINKEKRCGLCQDLRTVSPTLERCFRLCGAKAG